MAALVEIKGLGARVASVRSGIKAARDAAADVEGAASALAAELKDVHTQIEQARSDIRFEAETLGNSGNSAGT